MEQTFTVLRREQLLIDHAPHSIAFRDLAGGLLYTFSAAAVIPSLAMFHDVGIRTVPPEILNKPGCLTIVAGACGVFDPQSLACFAQNIDMISRNVYAPSG